jgi:propionyl-CoA synthetase
LSNQGIKKGDRVIIYMPMIPEAVVACHAVTRIGAIHSVVFGGFAPNELANRMKDAKPKAIITASCGLEPNKVIPYAKNVSDAILLSGDPTIKTIMKQRPDVYEEKDCKGFLDWDVEMSGVTQGHDCVPVECDHPFYLLYTSGTTGSPKGIMRTHASTMVALNFQLETCFNIHRGDTMLGASDIGWIVGHNFILYGP